MIDFEAYRQEKSNDDFFFTLATMAVDNALFQITQELNCTFFLCAEATKNRAKGDMLELMARSDPARIAMLCDVMKLQAGNLERTAEALQKRLQDKQYTAEQVKEWGKKIDQFKKDLWNESIVIRHFEEAMSLVEELAEARQQATDPTGQGECISSKPS